LRRAENTFSNNERQDWTITGRLGKRYKWN
jgi:hypothetical protein